MIQVRRISNRGILSHLHFFTSPHHYYCIFDRMKISGIIFFYIICIYCSCEKESIITSPDARVNISADTLKFDTVFVTTGSIYRTFTIVNDNDGPLKLSSIKLLGGLSSFYKMNVDGVSGTDFQNIEIEANDSVYVFVQVNVDPNAANLPFIIRDSIKVEYNGVDKLVQLEAWGLNAHFLRDEAITTNTTWVNDLPYVILGSLFIAPAATLTIESGCRIFVHANAPIVIDGTLKVNGLPDSADRVYFRGDRMDVPYRDFPASWPGLIFRSSAKDNVLSYTVIKNAYQAIGIIDPSINASPKLILNECIIDNAFDAGIISLSSSIKARNCLISNCGKNIVIAGGTYEFDHCTVVSVANRFIEHRNPVLLVSNEIGGASVDLTATFRNCIFWGENGTVTNEVTITKSGSTVFNVTFDHILWKVESIPSFINPPVAVINNQYPLFDSVNSHDNYYNFRLQSGSPAINKGLISAVIQDLDGKPRPLGLPDLGSFEKQ